MIHMGKSACLAGIIVVGAFAIPASAGDGALIAVARIEPGQWQLKMLGSAAPPQTLCIGDATVLIQYGHANAQCQRRTLANDANIAMVHYTCPGTGHGQTSVKVATPRSFELETQGILNGAPFEEHYEAHRIGACPLGAIMAR